LLLKGKIHFGYIYGVGAIGCISLCLLLNLMTETPVDLLHTTSVLGYCFLPIVALAFSSLVVPIECVLHYRSMPRSCVISSFQRHPWLLPVGSGDHLVHTFGFAHVRHRFIDEGPALPCGLSRRHALRLFLAADDILILLVVNEVVFYAARVMHFCVGRREACVA
jgi:hypothetical protein